MKQRIAAAFTLACLTLAVGCGGPQTAVPAPAAPEGAPAEVAGKAAEPADAVAPDSGKGPEVVATAASEVAKPRTPVAAKSAPKLDPNADLIGTWKGEIKLPETQSDDPMSKMAEGMAKMLMGSLKLEIKPGNAFVMSVMVPIEGTITRKDRKLTLKPTKMMGMTPEEAKKMAADNGGPDASMDPLTATVSADGKTITVSSDKADEGTMVFTRSDEPKKVVKPTVSAAEKAFVGQWQGAMSGSPDGATPEEKKQAEAMMKALGSSLSLELLADNTFVLQMMMEIGGKWSVKNGELRLDVLSINGMTGEAAQSEDEPIVFKTLDGGKTLRASKDGQTLTFKRR